MTHKVVGHEILEDLLMWEEGNVKKEKLVYLQCLYAGWDQPNKQEAALFHKK